jgi:hypothetical protein
MNGNLDEQIQKKEAEFMPLRQRMEELKMEFIKETIVFAAEWYRQTTKEYIAKYPDVTLKMSNEKIASMKNKISTLIQSNEKTISELNNPALWWHQKPNIHDSIEQYTQIADKYPEILDRAVRHALGRLGIILEEFNFSVTASGDTRTYKEFWFDHPRGTNASLLPYYPHLLKWSENMQETIKKYNTLYLQANALFKELQELKDEKKKQQAMSRWDDF